MEELREEALDFFNKCPDEIKVQAHRFFNSMDTNGDESISKKEFVGYFKERMNALKRQIDSTDLLEILDRDGSGKLDFDELITFFYILLTICKCNTCKVEFKAEQPHWTCVKCFREGEDTFDLCGTCYTRKTFIHKHDSFDQFGVLLCQSTISRTEKLTKKADTTLKVLKVTTDVVVIAAASGACSIM